MIGERCFDDIGVKCAVRDLFYRAYTPIWFALGMELVTGRYIGSFSDNKHAMLSFFDTVPFPIALS